MSLYKIIELVGTSEVSWEDAARNAIETARLSIRDLRVAEVVKFDIRIEEQKIEYRTRLQVSFKYIDDE